MIDDLFSDQPIEVEDTEAPSSDNQSSRMAAVDVEFVIQRNHDLANRVVLYLEQVEALRLAVFGDLESYDQFSNYVETRLDSDETFQKKHDLLLKAHQQAKDIVAEEMQRDGNTEPLGCSLNPRRTVTRSVRSGSGFVPGEPVEASIDVAQVRGKKLKGRRFI